MIDNVYKIVDVSYCELIFYVYMMSLNHYFCGTDNN